MNVSDLKGRAVVTLSDANKVGHIDDVLFDPQYRNVLGFRVKKSTFGSTEAVLRANVAAVGRDAVTVSGPDMLNAEDRFSDLAYAVPSSQARGTKVVSEGGEVVGTVSELELDDEAHSVIAYILAAPLLDRLRRQQQKISADKVMQIGSGGIMTIPNAVAQEIQTTS